ncbi:MFS transporter [Chryseobacterium sp. S-02]|uniref:MFS transporter n=1 Tax=unclassified Chryseobacterium TaxID=2593645 RepID=UPI00285879EE|nr:MFS transporter [Chryseobacterium sp. 2987]MDR6919941.1 putative MFS family arabinose efflux permease [Chryseobacterium sp. 2987]
MIKNKLTIPVMAFSAGSIVANVYYCQPILSKIAETTGSSESMVGKISVLTQVGYGLGMFFLLPLGDKVNRKKLILLICTVLISSLVAISFTERLQILLILSFLIGVLSTPAQIILPMAAVLDKENRGKNVGIVFSGILCGILSSRVIAGSLTDWWGWHSIYLFSAVMVSVSSLLMWFYLPDFEAKFKGSYAKLLSSTLGLIANFKILRQSALLGSFTFGVFCSFWTTLTFYLNGEPFNYSSSTIGMFGIIAIGGALVAPYFGKAADKGNVFKNLFFTVSLILVSIISMLIFPTSIWVLSVAIFFLDIGVQATQITNFTRIYSLNESAHSRLNTVYMTTYFIGAGTGTFFGLLSWSMGGWHFALLQMLLWSSLALCIVFLSKKGML